MTTPTYAPSYRYEATGVVANARLGPLLPKDWVDVTNKHSHENNNNNNNNNNKNNNNDHSCPDFLWENAPRQDTKRYRDDVKVYSHLPNGSAILDSKWVLGRLLTPPQNDENPLLAVCETHNFIGIDGFRQFAEQMRLWNGTKTQTDSNLHAEYQFPDILKRNEHDSGWLKQQASIPPRPDLWVLKDAAANGAGGVWVVGAQNVDKFLNSNGKGPLYKDHKYIAQQYVWPLVNFDGKKCHVRVYSTLTYDGRAFVHQRAFLHVANEKFDIQDTFEDTVHITNCCANSHDDDKFAGEILADFTTSTITERDGQPVIPLADFFSSVQATVAALCQKAFPFMEGGQRNNGFEYCGMDFMLSCNEQGTPLAYLLEINAPPSQDTATGLPHAENLHNDVLRDWMNFWVVPRVMGSNAADGSSMGGWKCVHGPKHVKINQKDVSKEDMILPSKAAILNKIRWGLFEKKALKRDEQQQIENEDGGSTKGTQQSALCENDCVVPSSEDISRFARSQFPYYTVPLSQQQIPPAFFENAGGAQVPQCVIDGMTSSLQFRHRSVIGSQTKAVARQTVKTLLGATERGAVVFGPNATGLVASLAQSYVQYKLLSAEDEVVLSTDNHKANFDPWIEAAADVGARVKLWSPSLPCKGSERSSISSNVGRTCKLEDLVTPRTRIVAMPHASNVLGALMPIQALTDIVKQLSKGHAHVIVDGVAAAPHVFPDFDNSLRNVDWYVVSMHKLFGPHIGVMLGRRGGAMDNLASASRDSSPRMIDDDDCLISIMEKGTMNIEGCAGTVEVGSYFKSLACFDSQTSSHTTFSPTTPSACHPGEMATERKPPAELCTPLSLRDAKLAYAMIRKVEGQLVTLLTNQLEQYPRTRLLKAVVWDKSYPMQLPTVSFVHTCISSQSIVEVCRKNGIICRNGSFLSTPFLLPDFGIDAASGVVRISLAHYNTKQELQLLFGVLEAIPGW